MPNESCCEGDAIEALFQLGPAHEPALMYRARHRFLPRHHGVTDDRATDERLRATMEHLGRRAAAWGVAGKRTPQRGPLYRDLTASSCLPLVMWTAPPSHWDRRPWVLASPKAVASGLLAVSTHRQSSTASQRRLCPGRFAYAFQRRHFCIRGGLHPSPPKAGDFTERRSDELAISWHA